MGAGGRPETTVLGVAATSLEPNARARTDSRRTGGGVKVATFVAVLVAAALAARSGLAVGGDSKSYVVLPLAVAVGVGLGLLALTRFQVYVMVMLVLRSSLDLAKLSGRTAGTTSVSGSARALDPSSILAVLFLLTALLWLVAQYRSRGTLPGSSLRRALLVFLAAVSVSITGSGDPTASAMEAMRIGAVVVMFVVLEQMMVDPATMRRILVAVFLSTIFPLVFTSFGILVGNPRSEAKGGFGRLLGTFNQSNDYSRYLMLMIIMGAALYPYLSRRQQRLATLPMAAMAVFLVLTYTRSALVATVLGLLVVGLIQSKRLLLGVVTAGIVTLLVVPSVSGRFTDIARDPARQAAQAGSIDTGNSLSWRLDYWAEVLPLANENPVTGIGLNGTRNLTDRAKQPHNDFVRTYVETGLLGLFSYLAMMVALVGTGRRAVRSSVPGSFDRGVAAGFLGCAVAFLAVSLVANVISNVVNLWYFFAFAAAASAVARRTLSPARGGNAPDRSSTVPEVPAKRAGP